VCAILAGASWCERGETQREDMGVAIDAAGVLMEAQALRPILKVLMTSPVRSRVVAKCVPVEGTVSVSGIQRVDGEEDGVAARLMKMNVGELTPPPPGFVFPGTVLDRNRGESKYEDGVPTNPDYWT
jgi:hypothetical protein